MKKNSKENLAVAQCMVHSASPMLFHMGLHGSSISYKGASTFHPAPPLSKVASSVHQRLSAGYQSRGFCASVTTISYLKWHLASYLLCTTLGKIRTSIPTFQSVHMLTSMGPRTHSPKGGHCMGMKNWRAQRWTQCCENSSNVHR